MDLIVETIRRTAADQKRSCGYAPYIQMLINAKLGKHAYLLDHPHLPLQQEFEDNEVVMDDNDPNLAAARMAAQATEAEAARNMLPPVPHLITQAEKMAFLVRFVQGMEKDISEILENQKSLKRIVESKFHDLDVKVPMISASVGQLKHKVNGVKTPNSTSDDEVSPPRTTTQFNTMPRSAVVLVSKSRPTSSAQASAPSASAPAPAPPVSTPPAPGHSTEAFVYALLSTPSSAAQRDD